MMPSVKGIHHVAVSVPSLEKAREFYRDILGLKEVSCSEWQPGNAFIDEIVGLRDSSGRTAMYRAQNAYIEVFEYRTPAQSASQDPRRPVNEYGYTHFGIQVEDIQSVYQRLLAAGLTFHTPPLDTGPSSASNDRPGLAATYGRDFFGNVFELLEINEGGGVPPL
jgi:catechol 2,3-dioxygenase-like lactoylglutathione lyase family enzyme